MEIEGEREREEGERERERGEIYREKQNSCNEKVLPGCIGTQELAPAPCHTLSARHSEIYT